MWRKTAICSRDELQESEDLCLTHGTAAGKYAGRLLKASYAAQPKGCPAGFVPPTHKKCKSTGNLSEHYKKKTGPFGSAFFVG